MRYGSSTTRCSGASPTSTQSVKDLSGPGGGGWLETKGINVLVTEKVDQSTLPLADRIPVCLEGIPVKLTEEPNTSELIPGFPLEELGLSPEDPNTDEEETNGHN